MFECFFLFFFFKLLHAHAILSLYNSIEIKFIFSVKYDSALLSLSLLRKLPENTKFLRKKK